MNEGVGGGKEETFQVGVVMGPATFLPAVLQSLNQYGFLFFLYSFGRLQCGQLGPAGSFPHSMCSRNLGFGNMAVLAQETQREVLALGKGLFFPPRWS